MMTTELPSRRSLSPWAKPFTIHVAGCPPPGTYCANGVNQSDALSSNKSSTVLEDNESKDEQVNRVVQCHSVDHPPIENSSTECVELKPVKCYYSKLDEDDPDVDSPCWKGLQNNNQTKPENIELPSLLLIASEQKTCKRLNPFAPLFFPRNTKQRRQEDGTTLNNWNSSSMLSSSFMVQPVQEEQHYYTSDGSSMNESCCGGSSNGSNNGADYATLLSAAPRLNIERMVGKINELSDLLLEHCLRDPYPLNAAEHDSIKHTLGNLTSCITHSAQHTSFVDSVGSRQGM